MKIARASLQMYVARVMIAVLGFVGIIYFSRSLGAHILGVYFLFQAVAGIMSVVVDLGIGEAAEKRISQGQDQSKYFTAALMLRLVSLTTVSGCVIAFQNTLNAYIGANLALFLILVLWIQQISALLLSSLRAEKKVARTAWIELTSKLFQTGSAIALVSFGAGVYALVCGLALGDLVAIGVSLTFISVGTSLPRKTHVRSLLKYSKYSTGLGVIGLIYMWMDTLIIGFLMTQTEVGIYETAWRVASLATIMSNAIGTVLFPQISEWETNGNMKAIGKALSRGLAYTVLIPIPAFLGASVISRDFLGVVFGKEFARASAVLNVLLFGKVFEALHIILSRILSAIGKPQLTFRSGLAGLVINAGLDLVLIRLYGIIGAAIASCVSVAVSMFLCGLYLKRYVVIVFPTRHLKWEVVAAVCMALSIYGFTKAIPISSELQLAVVVSLGVMVYVGIMMLDSGLRSEIIEELFSRR